MKGRATRYGVDPSWQGRISSFSDALQGKVVQPPMVVYEVQEWTVKGVEGRRRIDHSMFALKLPQGTAYFDARTLKGDIVATEYDLAPHSVRMPASSEVVLPPEASSHWNTRLAATCVLVVCSAAAVVLVVLIRKKGKSS
jgi:hypothetical protein